MAINTPMAVTAEPVADEQEAEDNVSTFSTSDEMGVRNCFYDFCKQTILHGWHYLADLENEATPSPSFVTFTPISSPNATLTGPKQPLMLHHRSRSRSSSPPTSRSRSRSGSHHHVTLNARASGSGHANVSITHHHHCCLHRGRHGNNAAQIAPDELVLEDKKKETFLCCFCRSNKDKQDEENLDTSYERRNSQLASSNNKRQPPQITHAGGGIDTTTENQSKLASTKKASDHTRSRLQHARSAFRSLFWTLIIMASVGSGGFFLHNNTSEFLNSTVQTTLDGSVPLSEVYFPSVVVCNINQIRKSFFAELGFYENDTLVRIVYEDFIKGTMEEREDRGADKDPKREAFYEVLKTHFEKNDLAVEGSLTWLSHQNCNDMFIYAKWNSSTTYGFGNNERDFGTDYGICCWYTPQLNFSAIPDGPDTNWAFWFGSVEKGAKTGKDNGFSVLFDIESYDYGYYDEGSEGLKVAIVHHLDMPIIRQRAFHVAPGTENQIPVTPTLYTTNPQALERFTPEERDCYMEDEIDLKYLPKDHGYRYEMSNCLFEAAYEKILEVCRCAPGFHNEGGASAYQSFPVCQGKELTCSNNILNRMGEFNTVINTMTNKTTPCLTNCEDQINELFVTTSNYPNKKTFKEREEFCLLVKKLIKTCKGHKRLPLSADYPNLCPTLEMLPNAAIYCNKHNRWRTEPLNNKTISKAIESEIHKYASENLAIINIFIKESYTKRFRKTEKMSRISYIASSGGLLGLCMGFSFVSLAEIAYHCFLCIVLLCRKKRALFKKAQIQKKKRRASAIQHRLEAAPPGAVNGYG